MTFVRRPTIFWFDGERLRFGAGGQTCVDRARDHRAGETSKPQAELNDQNTDAVERYEDQYQGRCANTGCYPSIRLLRSLLRANGYRCGCR
jgi:hypothetical protein